jgi:hypothetical protein
LVVNLLNMLLRVADADVDVRPVVVALVAAEWLVEEEESRVDIK